MRLSGSFFRSLRENPANAPSLGLSRLARAGLLRLTSSGVVMAPLGLRALRGVERRFRGLVGSPLPNEIRLAREDPIGSLVETVGGVVQSYRDLPRQLFLRQGLMPFHAASAWEEVFCAVRLSASQGAALDAEVFGWLQGLGWAARVVEAESVFSGARARAVVIEGQSGEARLLVCPNCGYGAEAGIAVFRRDILQRKPTCVEEVATPGATTIAALAAQLGIPASEAGKIVVLASGDPPAGPPGRIVMAIVPGDMGVSETKLRLATGLAGFRPASDEELRAHGVVPGYGSPVGARDLLVVVDEAVELSTGLVMGANREGYHRRGMVCGRDYRPDLVADIAAAAPGHGCLQCGSALKATRGICVARGGAIQTLNEAAVGCSFATADGETRPLRMEWIEIRAGRMLEAAAEEWGAEGGLFLPRWFSVCEVHLIVLDGGEDAAERLVEELAAGGIEALVDDRPVSAGIKFSDADWIGIPFRCVLGKRGLAKGVAEVAVRRGADWTKEEVALQSLAAFLTKATGLDDVVM